MAVQSWGQGAPREDLSQVTLRAPVPLPTKVIAAPVNYKLHQHEMGGTAGVYFGANIKTIEDYGLFLKPSSSIVGRGDVITQPFRGCRTDHEAEIGVIIGKRARNVVESEADSVIFGVTGLLDLSVRGGEDRPDRGYGLFHSPSGGARLLSNHALPRRHHCQRHPAGGGRSETG